MRFDIRLTPDALADLEEIYDRIARHDGASRAAHVEDRILAAIAALERHPSRGPHPAELAGLGTRDFRETLFKPYRIIYGVEERRVIVYLIADGRRDMQSLLARRLLAG